MFSTLILLVVLVGIRGWVLDWLSILALILTITVSCHIASFLSLLSHLPFGMCC